MSEATRVALNGAYETEPGHGGGRDDYLDKAGITTFLIVEKVLSLTFTVSVLLTLPMF